MPFRHDTDFPQIGECRSFRAHFPSNFRHSSTPLDGGGNSVMDPVPRIFAVWYLV
jgi:hypothetical protein